MNPLLSAVIRAALGRKTTCSRCGAVDRHTRVAPDRFRCRRCGGEFTPETEQ